MLNLLGSIFKSIEDGNFELAFENSYQLGFKILEIETENQENKDKTITLEKLLKRYTNEFSSDFKERFNNTITSDLANKYIEFELFSLESVQEIYFRLVENNMPKFMLEVPWCYKFGIMLFANCFKNPNQEDSIENKLFDKENIINYKEILEEKIKYNNEEIYLKKLKSAGFNLRINSEIYQYLDSSFFDFLYSAIRRNPDRYSTAEEDKNILLFKKVINFFENQVEFLAFESNESINKMNN